MIHVDKYILLQVPTRSEEARLLRLAGKLIICSFCFTVFYSGGLSTIFFFSVISHGRVGIVLIFHRLWEKSEIQLEGYLDYDQVAGFTLNVSMSYHLYFILTQFDKEIAFTMWVFVASFRYTSMLLVTY